jgi:hypothetical protein
MATIRCETSRHSETKMGISEGQIKELETTRT